MATNEVAVQQERRQPLLKASDIWILAVLAAAVAVLALAPKSVDFKADLSLGDVLSLLGVLFLIALVLERGLDVFLTAWRAADAESLELEIRKREQKLRAAVAARKGKGTPEQLAEAQRLQREITQRKAERQQQRSRTRCIALQAGLAAGILVSVVGVRVLNSLMDASQIEALTSVQSRLFTLIDIVVTGAMLAGGSEGIHKMTQVYRNFMERSSESLSKPAE
jgi:hypothetical protein